MLLNRVLTVRPGAPASHRRRGWEAVTDRAIAALVERGGPLVAVLWGRDAQSLKPALGVRADRRERAPEPAVGEPRVLRVPPVLRGSTSCLVAQGAAPVDWSLT